MNFTREDIKKDTEEIVQRAVMQMRQETYAIVEKATIDVTDIIKELMVDTEARFSEVHNEFAFMNRRLDSMDGRLKEVRSHTYKLTDMLKAVVNRQDDHGGRIVALEKHTGLTT